MTRDEVIGNLGQIRDVLLGLRFEGAETIDAAIALLSAPPGDRVVALERQWHEENLRCQGLTVQLAHVNKKLREALRLAIDNR